MKYDKSCPVCERTVKSDEDKTRCPSCRTPLWYHVPLGHGKSVRWKIDHERKAEDDHHVRFIVQSFKDFSGSWGRGEDLVEAKANLKKNNGKVKNIVKAWKFTSDLPFAPGDREANEDESDAYISNNGMIHWIRCHREEIEI